jgi:hypothetical protein
MIVIPVYGNEIWRVCIKFPMIIIVNVHKQQQTEQLVFECQLIIT